MKLFQDSRGFIIAFGFDMEARKPDPYMIAWCDPGTGIWSAHPANMAGSVKVPFNVAPEFMFEVDGRVVAYQPGRCIEMTFLGNPLIWQVRYLTPAAISNAFANAA